MDSDRYGRTALMWLRLAVSPSYSLPRSATVLAVMWARRAWRAALKQEEQQ